MNFIIIYDVSEIIDITATAAANLPGIYKNEGSVFVMYAGSLVKIFEDVIGPAFQNESGYSYVGEGRGSIQVANMIKDGFRTPDVFVSAGIVPMLLLMNSSSGGADDAVDNNNNATSTEITTTLLSQSQVDWFIEFGSAEIVISYSPKSMYFNDLEKAKRGEIPWYEVISQDGFKFGRTDPELDPKGYYTIISLNLANMYYNDSSIKEKVLGDDRNPKQIFPEETLKTVLEAGQVDAVASYKHEAIARGLSYITLPDEINLSNSAFSSFYKKSNYTLESNKKIINGEPIYFSITIPKTVKNLSGAISFVNFILSKKGSQLLETQGLAPINITAKGDTSRMPISVKESNL